MRAKIIATEGSTETGLVRFLFETTFEEAATIKTISPEDVFLIVKASKCSASFHGEVIGMLDGGKTIACDAVGVNAALKDFPTDAKVVLVCTALD
jgi:hypothetical protein